MASSSLPPRKFTDGQLFVESQFRTKPRPPPSSISLDGQTAIVTGSNVGIGLECSRILLDMGLSHLIMAVRTISKGEAAAEPMRKTHSKANIEVWQLDMSSYDSIQAFASRCTKELSHVDLAILNASLFPSDFVKSPTGHEESVQVNFISTALLAIVLLPVLKSKGPESQPGRLTIVSSSSGLSNPFPERDASPLLPALDDKKGYDDQGSMQRYTTTKMLQLMIMQKLSEAVSAEHVVVNAVEPGLVAGSGLHRHLSAPKRAMFWVLKTLFARSVTQGAWAYLDAAVVRGKESHGGFGVNWDIYPLHPFMYTTEGEQATNRLWNETLEELDAFGVKSILQSFGQAPA